MRTHTIRALFGLSVVILLSVTVFGQDNRQQTVRPIEAKPPVENAGEGPGDLLRQLGLSREQMQQLRRINMDRKPLLAEAQRRSREANRSLDEAIYADRLDETEVQARLKEVQISQAELAKVRYTNELSVRRILTPDQLVHFRALRQKFEQERMNNKANAARGQTINNQKPAGAMPFRNIKRQLPLVRPLR